MTTAPSSSGSSWKSPDPSVDKVVPVVVVVAAGVVAATGVDGVATAAPSSPEPSRRSEICKTLLTLLVRTRLFRN